MNRAQMLALLAAVAAPPPPSSEAIREEAARSTAAGNHRPVFSVALSCGPAELDAIARKRRRAAQTHSHKRWRGGRP